MPIYEYECRECGERTEVLQNAKDKPPACCPKCGGAVVKIISPPAIQFKGQGWYITDYAKKSSPATEHGPAPRNGPKDAPKDGHGGAAEKKPEKTDPSGA